MKRGVVVIIKISCYKYVPREMDPHWRTQDLKKGGVAVEGQKGGGGGVREGDVPPPARSAEAFENVNSVC